MDECTHARKQSLDEDLQDNTKVLCNLTTEFRASQPIRVDSP
jgi:hypothetical protein